MTIMDEDTDYVHTAVVNYEPTYLVLDDAARRYHDDEIELWEARDLVTEAVERMACSEMGLRPADLIGVDYGLMVQFEAGV